MRQTHRQPASNAARHGRADAGHGPAPKTGVPRFMQPQLRQSQSPSPSPSPSPSQSQSQSAVRPVPGGTVALGRPGDSFEQEADRMADLVRESRDDRARAAPRDARLAPASPTAAHAPPSAASTSAVRTASTTAPAPGPRSVSTPSMSALPSDGRPLDTATRDAMEPHFGRDLSHVRLHSGSQAASLNRDLGSRAFTLGGDIYFGAGHGPQDRALMAHELTHAVQQSGGSAGAGIGAGVNAGIGTGLCAGLSAGISAHAGPPVLQRDLMQSMPVPLGGFEIGMAAANGTASTPPTFSGLRGTIRFLPDVDAPNSNQIALVQIVRLTDLGGTDVNPQSMAAPQAPRGALGDPGVRTETDGARGVDGGFFTDVLHKPLAAGAPATPGGSPLSPNYPFSPSPTGGGTGPQTPGFKRSSDPADIRSASLFDAPGSSGTGANFDFSFETVARSEDTGVVYGALSWGFRLQAGVVAGEFARAVGGQSATFDEALERHRDFYVHEPVSFYFAFDSAALAAGEAAKIDEFLPYLARNPTVHLALEGFADQVGGASAYNADLSLRRASSVEAGLLARGVSAARIDGILLGHGASTAATTNAGTGDQGGNAAVGADQSRDANRQMNRRVLLTFTDTAPPAATPAPAPAGP